MSYCDETAVQCPYCGETIQIFLDSSAGSQEYYEDCSVCCAPIFFRITETDDEFLQVEAKREDDL
ncbi:MAG: CPXCG motif-containing cysteine-rich protein [Gammaproteobacteria bacterium HGW-Gammaproteobacteria-10]|nr:MAG: CPXCG motif-containing cysteine-rich protein [Gammaproteobacteria bacterium HGW-Gammaproteobacteria-3]PKM35069.1 MAG: CPXCG motif-containing cysteine-rich protein [Gammaproteobacteria bacterium HGW-Gammaproteobacteria-10]